MPRRTRKVYERPASVATGSETARSGTSCLPAVPPTLRNPVRPSFVSATTAHAICEYPCDGSTFVRPPPDASTVSLPPRWPAPDAPTATNTAPFAATSPCGRLPVVTVSTTASRSGSILDRVAESSLLTQTARVTIATPFGPSPTPITARMLFVPGWTVVPVSSNLSAPHPDPRPTATAFAPVPAWTVSTTRPV